MHAQPKRYCIMLGSGASRGAGLRTGWEVTQELVLQAACADDPGQTTELRRQSDEKGWAEKWWHEHEDSPLGYSQVLDRITSDAEARRDTLSKLFTHTRDEEPVKPSIAHQKIARMVKAGYVTVIVTTNFDRLMEKALQDAGVTEVQVISNKQQAKGAIPLSHGTVTVIKVNGDYTDRTVRNTTDELKKPYSGPLEKLITQVFNDFGVIVSGWTAEWDIRLRGRLESSGSRFGLYWDSRSGKNEYAQAIIRNTKGKILESPSADRMFTDLDDSLVALERLQVPRLTTDMAVAKLKRFLPDPVHRIDLHDLVIGEADRVMDWLESSNIPEDSYDKGAVFQEAWNECLSQCDCLLRLLTTGIWHDSDDTHKDLWLETLQRLLDRTQIGRAPGRAWPALLVHSVFGALAALTHREQLYIEASTKLRMRTESGKLQTVAQGLWLRDIVNEESANSVPDAHYLNRFYPADSLVIASLEPLFGEFVADTRTVRNALIDRLYRLALMNCWLPLELGEGEAESGIFLARNGGWTHEDVNRPFAQIRFLKELSATGRQSWSAVFPNGIDAAVDKVGNMLRNGYYHSQPC